MILFKEDWDTHPGAIPDYKTTNRSWVRMAGVLHKMGISNSVFLLALHNTDLQGIDPFDDNLTQEQQIAISIEAKENPWYCLRELIKVPPIAGPDPVNLRANRANISLWWLFFNHITTMLIQPRQTGKSISTDALMVALVSIATINTDISLLTKDDSLRVKNVQRVKDIIANLPEFLKLRVKGDTNNTERITVNMLGNKYHTSVAQASEKAALNLGRGMSIAIHHIDEIAYVSNIAITLPALLASSGAARDAARETGTPYGNIFTTTPGYLSSKSGKFAYSIYNNSFKWSEKLFDSKNEEGLVEIIRKNTPGGRVQVILDYNHRQLGFTDQWVKDKIADAMSSGEDAGADFLNLWAEGSERSPIDKNLLKIIKDSKIDNPYVEISKYGYVTNWYVSSTEVKDKLSKRKLIATLDTSDAVGKDDIGLYISDSNTGETLATGVYNETNLITFSEWIMSLIIDYPNLTLIIERRSSGVAILDNLIRLCVANDIDPFARLFNWVTNDADVNSTYRDEVIDVALNKRSSSVYEKYRSKFGYATSGAGRTSRNVLYGEVFTGAIRYIGHTTRSSVLIDQIAGLTIRNDRIDHRSGSNDDLVIAWLLAYWFLTKANNKSFYGLKQHQVLTTVVTAMVDEQGGEQAVAIKNYQIQLKGKIDTLIDELRRETSVIKSAIKTNKLKHLYGEIDTTIIQPINIDSLLENIELEKRKKRIRYNY